MESWCSLLTLDPYLEICRTLGCLPETEEEQVAVALNQSIHFESSVVSSTMSSDRVRDSDRNIVSLQFSISPPYRSHSSMPRQTQRDGFAPPVSSLWEKTKGDLVSSSILNPYLLRSVLKSEELESLSCVIVKTRRSVRDLQAVLHLQLAQIAAAHGRPLSPSLSLSSAHSHCHTHPPLHRYLFFEFDYKRFLLECFMINSKLRFLFSFFYQWLLNFFHLFYYFSQVLRCFLTSTQSA
jgi:hypothetical protein